MVKLITEQDNYLTIFKRNSTPEILEFYNEAINDKEVKTKVFDKVAKLRHVALNSNQIGVFGVEANYWFDQSTKIRKT